VVWPKILEWWRGPGVAHRRAAGRRPLGDEMLPNGAPCRAHPAPRWPSGTQRPGPAREPPCWNSGAAEPRAMAPDRAPCGGYDFVGAALVEMKPRPAPRPVPAHRAIMAPARRRPRSAWRGPPGNIFDAASPSHFTAVVTGHASAAASSPVSRLPTPTPATMRCGRSKPRADADLDRVGAGKSISSCGPSPRVGRRCPPITWG